MDLHTPLIGIIFKGIMLFAVHQSEMRYCEISKEMSSLYFGLALFCVFETRVLEFNMNSCPPTAVECIVYIVHRTRRQILGL
jgi:hypothetical protein